jgi:mannose-6-phosphate isomerase-like protein (cupin superfamily)
MAYIDPVQASPANYKALMENDQVRVVEMTLRPGEKDEWHSHPDETVYFVRGSKVRITLEDGGSMEADLPDGHVMWHEAWTHQVENLGSGDLRAIIVESKQ